MIGAVAHRADDHHDLVAFLLGADGLAGRGQNLLAVGHAGAAEFLNDDRHGGGCQGRVQGSKIAMLSRSHRALRSTSCIFPRKYRISCQPSSNASFDWPAAVSS